MAGLTIARDKYEDFKADANNALFFKLVRTEDDIDKDDGIFHPEMTHQVFGEMESIFGYKDLRVDVYFTAAKMMTYVGIKYTDKVDKDGLQADDIMKLLGEHLSSDFTTSIDDFAMHITKDRNFTPFGDMVHTYSVSTDGCERHFEIYKTTIDAGGFRAFHSRVQPLLLFYVDAASYIDVDDERWAFYVVFERYKSSEGDKMYAYVGYMTAYNYYAYPAKVRPRISQVLVLPPYQRQGHGTMLIETFYRECFSRAEVLDITVEDPSEDFQRVRDFIDTKNCVELPAFQKDIIAKGFKEQMCKEAREKYKLNKKQVRRVYEILRLHYTDIHNDKEYATYRLDVKRRLNAPFQKNGRDQKKIERLLRPDELAATLGELSTNQRLEYLETTYKCCEDEYNRVLKRLSL